MTADVCIPSLCKGQGLTEATRQLGVELRFSCHPVLLRGQLRPEAQLRRKQVPRQIFMGKGTEQSEPSAVWDLLARSREIEMG